MTSARPGPLLVACLTLLVLTPGCVQNMDALKDALGADDEPAPQPEPEPEPEPEPATPIAKADANATRVVAGEPILFTAAGSRDPDGGALTYEWAFGDGHTGEGDTVTHAYSEAGAYVARLTVRNPAGKADVDSIPITVRKANEPPIAHIGRTPEGAVLADATVNFTAAGSRDPDGGALTYEWAFGDGATSTEETPAHAYARPGRYDVLLTVRDPTGLEANATGRVVVEYDAHLNGTLSPVSAPTARHAIPVAANATRLNLTLEYAAAYGTNTLRLAVLDAAGNEVANATGQGTPGDDGARALHLELDADALAGRAGGDWVLRIDLKQGLGGAYGLRVIERLT